MKDFTIAELGVFLGVVGGVMTSLILTIQKSRCETIDCCGVKCKIKPKKTDAPIDLDLVPPAPRSPGGQGGASA